MYSYLPVARLEEFLGAFFIGQTYKAPTRRTQSSLPLETVAGFLLPTAGRTTDQTRRPEHQGNALGLPTNDFYPAWLASVGDAASARWGAGKLRWRGRLQDRPKLFYRPPFLFYRLKVWGVLAGKNLPLFGY